MKVIIEIVKPNKTPTGATKKPIILPSRGEAHTIKDNRPIAWYKCLSEKMYKKLSSPVTLKGCFLEEKTML